MGLTTIINDPVTLFFAGFLVGEFITLKKGGGNNARVHECKKIFRMS